VGAVSGSARKVNRGSVAGSKESDGGGGELEVGRDAVKARINEQRTWEKGGPRVYTSAQD